MEEIWKRLKYDEIDYGDRYLISNYGRIKNIQTGHIRKLSLYGKSKYYQIIIQFNNKKKTIKVHRAVAQNFIPNPGCLPEVNHKDGNKLNNNVDNLEWVTTKENQIHAVINKLTKSGEDSKLSKLTEAEVKYIKENCITFDKNFGCKALAEKFNVDHTTISKIIHNYSWKKYSSNYEQLMYEYDKTNIKNVFEKQCLFCKCVFKTKNINQKYCSIQCRNLNEQKLSKRPERDVLERLICDKSFVEIGKMFSVSDNAIRRWCKYYDLPYRRKDINIYKKNNTA